MCIRRRVPALALQRSREPLLDPSALSAAPGRAGKKAEKGVEHPAPKHIAIALVTDDVFHRDDALRWSMAIVGGACCWLALAILVWSRPAHRQSVRRAQQWLRRRGDWPV